MRFRYPKVLHKIYKFQLEGKCYVADLDCGQTLEVSEVLFELLDLCERESLHGILQQMSPKYKEGQIFAGIEALENYARSGLLVSSLSPQRFLEGREKERLKLFVPYDFLGRRERLDALTNFNLYQLLIALAKQADIYIAIHTDEPEPHIDFGAKGIHPLAVEPGRLHSPVRFVMDDCDGVLLLSQHPQSELVFFRHLSVPVVCRIEADCKAQASLPELVLNSFAALKDWDALCVAASWLKDSLGAFLPSPSRLLTIPSGADLESFAPMEKQVAKKMAVEMFGDENLSLSPVVGILPGLEPRTAAKIAFKLAFTNPHLTWLVLDPVLENFLFETVDNLHFFGVRSFQERNLLPVIFNAFDLFCFAAMPGTSASLVLEAMACGIPPVVISKRNKLPEEMGDAGILVKAQGAGFDELLVAIAPLSQAIHQLLKDEVEYFKQAQAAKTAAVSYTWDETAQRLLSLFQTLNERRKTAQRIMPASFPFLFTPYYDKAKDALTFLAFDTASHSYRNIEAGLAWSLLEEGHTRNEIETVLQHICQDEEKVKWILEQLRES